MKIWTVEIAAPIACLFAAGAFSSSMLVTNDAWAKHTKPTQPGSSDPCVEPTAFVQDHIEKIRKLKATLSAKTNSTVVSLFGGGGNTDTAHDTVLKISDLRHDADGVNELLRAGGCKAIDIAESLKTAAATPAAAPAQTKKRKHH